MKRLLTIVSTAMLLPLSVDSHAQAGPAYTDLSAIREYNPREFGLDIYLPEANNPLNCSRPGLIRIKKDADNY